ncbi:MAG: ATP-binding protein [Pseudomonadota bacterium]
MPLAVFWSWPYSRVLDNEMADVYQRHLLIAQNLASSLDRYHNDLETLFTAYREVIASGHGQEAQPVFQSLWFRHVCVADAATGAVLVDYLTEEHPCPDTIPPDRLALFRDLVAGSDVGISPVFRPPGELPRIFLATQVEEMLVVGAVHTDYFDDLRRQVGLGRDGHVAIVDQTGHAITHRLDDQILRTIDLSEVEPVQRLLRGESGVTRFRSPIMEQEMIAGFAPVPDVGWGVLVPQPFSELEEAAAAFNRDAVVVLSIGLGLSLLMALVVSVQFSRRLDHIGTAVHEIAQEHDNVRVSPSRDLIGVRELLTLESDVDQLAQATTTARRANAEHASNLQLTNEKLIREMEERRSAEAARKSSEIRFQSLFESAPIPIREEDLSGMKAMIDQVGISDPDAFAAYLDTHPEFLDACSKEIIVVDANKASLELHGYTSKSEMLDNVVRSLSPSAKKIVRLTVETLHAGARGRSYETIVTGRDGSVKTVAATWTVIPGHEETYARILLSSVDLTDRLKSEEALRQAQKMEAVGQLTGGVAHDFNNLLTAINGNLDLMAETQDLDADLVDPIRKAVRRGSELTQRLLAFSRKQPLAPRPIHLGQLVAGMTDMLRRSIGEEIAIEIDCAESLWNAIADPGQVETSLLNLALNARDAMPGGGTLKISSRNAVVSEADPADAAPGDYVVLTVTDTGSGMAQDVLDRAYEPFFTTKEVGRGTGLGLSTIYGFAKQSGGDVQINSAPGRGTTVSLYLPRTTEDVVEPPAQHHSSLDPVGDGQTVLILEDDAGVRRYLLALMESLGFRGLVAENGLVARELLESGEKIDLLVSDVMLPGGVRGPEFASELVHTSPATPVILMSGRPFEEEDTQMATTGSTYFLKKPFTRDEMTEKIVIALQMEADRDDRRL